MVSPCWTITGEVWLISLQAFIKQAKSLSTNEQSSPAIGFKDKTVIVTGAGAGLGRSYAIMFGKLGANVVVNDVSQDGANKVAEEVKKGQLRFISLSSSGVSGADSRQCSGW